MNKETNINNFVDAPTTLCKQAVTDANHIANNFILFARQYKTIRHQVSLFSFFKILLVIFRDCSEGNLQLHNTDKPETPMYIQARAV